MKKAFATLLLILFVLQSTMGLWQTLFFYIQRDYISNTLCVNRFDAIPLCKGQCFLNKTLNETKKKEQQNPDLKFKEVQLFFQDLTLEHFISAQFKNSSATKKRPLIHIFLGSKFLNPIFHPPPYSFYS